jgi:pimeloyl-ACP methyl ester carboxylesterase
MIANPAWEDGLAKSLGAVFSPLAVYEIAAGLTAPDGATVGTGMLKNLFSPGIREADFAWTLQQVTKMEMKNASALFVNHAGQDWRDVLSTITVPTLITGGELSIFNSEAIEWIANQIPGAKFRVFGKDEGGSHFMFWENADGFNEALTGFLKD